MRSIDIVVKVTDPIRVAETTGVAAGFGHENIGPVFEERLPVVWRKVAESGVARPDQDRLAVMSAMRLG